METDNKSTAAASFPSLKAKNLSEADDELEAHVAFMHYLASGHVSGTVILLRGAGLNESDIPKLLASLDDDFLPDVDLKQGTLTYTVVLGEVLGNYEASQPAA